MKKFAFFSDLLFTLFLSGIFTLALFRSLGISLPLALLLSLCCGGLTTLSVGAILRVKRKNLYLKKSDETIKQKLLLHLSLLSDEQKTELFTTLLSTEQEPINRFGKLRIFNRTEFFFLKFSLTPLSADEIPNLARLKTGKKKVLLCSQIEEAALSLCRRLDIDVKTGEWVYALFKERDLLPKEYLGDVPQDQPKRKIKLWFSRKNAKRFLVGGGLILLFARFTPFFYYYLLIGALLLLVAIFVRIFGYE